MLALVLPLSDIDKATRTTGMNPKGATEGKRSGVDPKQIPALLQKATALHQSGNASEALAIYQEILAARPDHPTVLNLSGVAAYQLGDNERALLWLQTAADVSPDNPDVHYNLGLVLKDRGRLEDAVTAWQRAIQLKPDHASVHNNLGNALQLLGRLEEAEAAYQRAIECDPRHANAHNNLGMIRQRLDKPEEALAAFRLATRLAPRDALFWQNLATCLAHGARGTPSDEELRNDLQTCLANDGVDPVPLGNIVTRVLRHEPDISCLLDPSNVHCSEDEDWVRMVVQVLEHPLLTLLLEKLPISDIDLEALLVAVRRALLRLAIDHRLTKVVGRRGLAFLCALAQQCFLNEYVFFESEEEGVWVAAMQERIETRIAAQGPVDPTWIALFAAYRPLHATGFVSIFDREDSYISHPLLGKVIVRQAKEPMEERAIRETIPRISAITDGVSRAVRAQYEENPYPRWVGTGTMEPRSTANVMTTMFPYLQDRNIPWPESPQILVAGCGTGKHPIMTARCFAGAQVLAIDLSLASLSYGARRAKEMGVTNVRFAHGDLMAMGDLGHRFDIIECIAVLHHLEEPIKGWRILVGLLNKDGLMGIGLYSELARRKIVAARAFIEEHGYPSSPEGIRRCRQAIMALPDDSLIKQVTRGRHFYTTSECRDLIFHVQEHRLNLLQVSDALDELGLELLGFQFQDPSTLQRYRARFPEDRTATCLQSWHRFELDNPNTFTSMYQFWVRKR